MGKRWTFKHRLRAAGGCRPRAAPRRPAPSRPSRSSSPPSTPSATATRSAAGSACAPVHDHATRRRPRRCSSRSTLLRFPKGAVVNGRFFPKCKRRGPARARAAGLPAGLEARLGHGASAPRPRSSDNVNAKITLFNGAGGGRNPTSSSTRSRPRPGHDAARRVISRAAAPRTATCSTSTCRRSRRCRARPTRR